MKTIQRNFRKLKAKKADKSAFAIQKQWKKQQNHKKYKDWIQNSGVIRTEFEGLKLARDKKLGLFHQRFSEVAKDKDTITIQ